MTQDSGGDSKRPSWQLPEERPPDPDAYHIWTPRPLLRSIYWKPSEGGAQADPPLYDVFIDQRAWRTMHEHVWQMGADRTPFGYLVGDLCEDPNAKKRFLIVTAALPARFAFNEDGAPQITKEARLALKLEVERRRGELVGWYHRHVGGEVLLSKADLATHRKNFHAPWHFALLFVGGGDRCEGGCFRHAADEKQAPVPMPFYEMASNESLLARGMKRSLVDWSNYVTVDEIRREELPRRELPLPESERPPEAAPATAQPGDPDFDALADEVLSAPVETDDEDDADASPVEPGAAEGPVVDSDELMPPPPPKKAVVRDEPDSVVSRPPPRPVPSTSSEGPLEVAARELASGPPAGVERDRVSPQRNRTRLLWLATGALLVAAAVVAGLLTFAADEPATSDDPVIQEAPVAGAGESASDAEADTVVTVADIERESENVLTMISRFYGRAVERDNGQATCDDLSAAFVAVEDAWLRYSTQYRSRFDGELPEGLAERDGRLFAGVQDAEREFVRSGCPRP